MRDLSHSLYVFFWGMLYRAGNIPPWTSGGVIRSSIALEAGGLEHIRALVSIVEPVVLSLARRLGYALWGLI